MTIVKLNKRAYVSKIHGRGINGKYSRVLRAHKGYGIVDDLGQSATKYVLSGLGKTTGAYAGKQLGRMIKEKTGSDLLGKIAQAGLSALGGVAGANLGKQSGKLLGRTVFAEKEDEKKKKKKDEDTTKMSLSQMLEQARNRVGSAMQGNGINLIH
jgi:hypothetical protein